MLTAEPFRVRLTEPQAVGHTSAVLWRAVPDRGEMAVVLAPGAGSDVSDPVLAAVGRGLALRGHPAVAFQFAYTEAGHRRPDPMGRCEGAFRDVVAHVRSALGAARPLVIGGRSMGGRVASRLAVDATWAEQPTLAGLLLLAYPLHPARRVSDVAPVPPERLRTGHWPALQLPMLFVHGDRDRLCDLDTFAAERAAHLDPQRVRVHVLAGADHAFATRKRDGRTTSEVCQEAGAVAGSWIEQLMGGRGPGCADAPPAV